MKKNSNSKRNLEIIEWVDSAGMPGWHSIEEQPKITEIISCGWIAYEDKIIIVVTSHIDKTNDNHRGDLTIPKVSITKRTKIR